MLHLDFTIEDNRVILTRRDLKVVNISRDDSPTANVSGKWVGTISDNLTGLSVGVAWNDSELGAVLALVSGLGEDNPESELTTKLYEIAEPLFTNVPNECRLIP